MLRTPPKNYYHTDTQEQALEQDKEGRRAAHVRRRGRVESSGSLISGGEVDMGVDAYELSGGLG